MSLPTETTATDVLTADSVALRARRKGTARLPMIGWASLALACALGVGSCGEGLQLSPASSPTTSPAPARRRPPPRVERCADEAVVIEAPVCG